jgi:5-methylcytosine-specific restriction protein A
MLNKPCPRCKTLIPYGRAYCEACLPIVQEQQREAKEYKATKLRQRYNKKYNSRRDPKYLTFYRSKEWKLTSRTKLQQARYKCEARLQGCTGLAVEVHHTKPIQTDEGWMARLEWDNLEAVCTACHNGRHPEKFKRKEDPNIIDIRKIQR